MSEKEQAAFEAWRASQMEALETTGSDVRNGSTSEQHSDLSSGKKLSSDKGEWY